MHIELVSNLTGEVFESVKRLVAELGAHKPIPTREELIALIDSGASKLWIARESDGHSLIVGMLTLTVYRVPTGIRSIVEDVAVDSKYRRRGIAKALMETVLEYARQAGADVLTLSSNPQREAANLLYQSMGFERRNTNAYLYTLK
jgi:ribosomal protein S18 acetylase RimI-like enzyme